jgi:ABC-type glycerol-3-phosphate transport system substrate-binding protein
MMRVRWLTALAALAVTLGLAACGEKPQTASGRKADAQAWDAAAKSAYVAPGWSPGDQASWEEQIHKRAQSQNEYVRSAATGNR